MKNQATLLSFLKSNPNNCDDCLSDITKITPRQQINSLCRSLHKQGQVIRIKNNCISCNKIKITNSKKAKI